LTGNAREIGGTRATPSPEWDIMLPDTRMKTLSLPRPEAVLFDFDGVLVDSEPMHYRAFTEVLDPLGMGFPWKEYVEVYMGFDDRDAFREAFRAKGIGLDDANLAKLVTAKSEAFLRGMRDGVTAYPGAVALIESLRAAGRALALCSGALRSDIDPILAQLRVARCFDVIVSADDVRRSKPDPESYRLAFARLSEKYDALLTVPEKSVAVEDTPAGIRSAKGAGLRVLAVTNSYSAGELAEADWISDSLESVRFEG
jgi:beta-phosphoglucomutase